MAGLLVNVSALAGIVDHVSIWITNLIRAKKRRKISIVTS